MNDEKYVSPQQHQISSRQPAPKKPVTFSPAWVTGLIALAVVLCGLSFFGGVSYQKNHQPAAKTTGAFGGAGGFQGRGGFGQQGGGIGQVTAVSSTGITVQDQRSGTSTTYTITSSTTVTDNGQTVTVDDVKAGDTVIVMPSSSSSTTASRIIVNPSFGGGGSPDQSSGSSTTQTQ